LVLVLRGRAVAGFAVLGLATMTKGFPIVVAPVALAWLPRREALRAAALLAGIVIVLAGAAVAVSPSGALDAVRYQTDRPVQVESLPSLALRAVDPHARSVKSYRSDGLVSAGGGPLTAAFAPLGRAAGALLRRGAARA